jgi:hypothetical protein
MPVVNELAGSLPSPSKANAVNDVVQASFQKGEKNFSSHASLTFRFLEEIAKLLLGESIRIAKLLLFVETYAIVLQLAPKVTTMLTGRVGPALESLVCREQSHPEASVDASRGASVARHIKGLLKF